jgi:hypothetical protein
MFSQCDLPWSNCTIFYEGYEVLSSLLRKFHHPLATFSVLRLRVFFSATFPNTQILLSKWTAQFQAHICQIIPFPEIHTFFMLSENHARRRQELNVSEITTTLSRTPQSICHERESQQSGNLNVRTLQLKRRKILSSQVRSFFTLHSHWLWYSFTKCGKLGTKQWRRMVEQRYIFTHS